MPELLIVLATCRQGTSPVSSVLAVEALNFPVLPAANILIYLFTVLIRFPRRLRGDPAPRKIVDGLLPVGGIDGGYDSGGFGPL